MEKEQESFLQMHLDYDGGNILRETVRWSRFLSIVGFIFVGIFALVVLVAGSAIIGLFSRFMNGFEGLGAILIAVILLCLAIGGVLAYMLYRFSTLTRKGIESQDHSLFLQGMKGLKTYFLISGVIAILGLLLNLFNITKLFH